MKRFWLCVFLWWSVQSVLEAQMVSSLHDLPVRWEQMEEWSWQGQAIQSQRFESDQNVMELAQSIQQRLAVELRIQRLSSAWLLSFEEQQIHYLVLLSAQTIGSQGWLSSLSLSQPLPTVPALFNNLYQHSWALQHPSTEPAYFILQTASPYIFWQQVVRRLRRQGWQSQSCTPMQWCQWQLRDQKLMFWSNSKNTLWHVLWWESGRGNP